MGEVIKVSLNCLTCYKGCFQTKTCFRNHYEAKMILCPLGIEYWKIHECINDCILYINEFVEMCKCPKCRVSWYKVKDDDCSNEESTKKDPPTKVCWYLPIIQWFKQLFANEDNTKNLEWHVDGRTKW